MQRTEEGKPQVALVTLGDSRREFYQQRIAIVEEEMQKAKTALEKCFTVYQSPIVYSDAEAEAVARQIRGRGIGAVVIHLPIWGTPALALRIAQSTERPVAVLANKRKDSSSLVVMLAVAGMLDQCAKPCVRIAGEVNEPETFRQLEQYVRACALVEAVRASEYCMVGGRSIGIGTTVADPAQWARVFGTSFDHADQLEVCLRAEKIDAQRVARHLDWWKKQVKIEFGGRFTPESLDRQMRSYLALRDMAAERGYDFLGLKCQQEMSDHYALQCLAVALLNNDCDADGPKVHLLRVRLRRRPDDAHPVAGLRGRSLLPGGYQVLRGGKPWVHPGQLRRDGPLFCRPRRRFLQAGDHDGPYFRAGGRRRHPDDRRARARHGSAPVPHQRDVCAGLL